MVDKRSLVFPEPKERYDFDRELILFRGKDGDKIVPCAISREALADHFGGNDKDPLKILTANHEQIEHEARRKYIANQLEPDGSILIRTTDV